MQPIIVWCVAALSSLVALLGFWVSLVRSKSGVIYHGAGMDPGSQLAKAVRAHGNATEYSGVLVGLFIATALLYRGVALEHWVRGAIIVITAARIGGAVGFLSCETLEKVHPLKALSALCTYLGILALSANLLLKI